MLGKPERDIRRHQRQRDLDARVAGPAAQAQAQPADADAVADLAHHDEGEGSERLTEGEQASAYGGDREPVKDQRRGVVREALAFEHNDEPARQPETAGDRQRRDNVGRRHDGAEHER